VSELRLYSYWRSSASYRVRIGLELKGLDYEYVPVHLLAGGGQQFSPVYTTLNPQARVPTLVTPDGPLTQSMAILEWLEEWQPMPPLLPTLRDARARVRAMAQLMIADVQPLMNIAAGRALRDRMAASDDAIQAWRGEWARRGFTALEQLLEREPLQGRCCVGDMPTLADACLVPQCYSARRFGVDLAPWPRVEAIEQHCLSLAAFRRAAPEQQPDAQPDAQAPARSGEGASHR
jgi:maleylacetoacetate isomerase